ncbi:MAG: competence protein ComEA [Firmicutes bacterium]|nr:competence protein ComEA [Bacillota bacterium]
MNKIKKKIDNRLLIFLLLFIITICGISYSKMRKKTLLTFGTEKEFISPQYSLNVLDSITVEIEGEIKYPGIYNITEGYTLKDVVEKAGGLTEYANVVPLDWNVFDGQKIVIPKKEENFIIEYSSLFLEQKQKQENEQQYEEISEDTKRLYININTADVEELDLLPGIGEKLAESIISYRTENGFFQTIEDIKNVPKIGDSIFEKIKDYITIQ